MKIKEGMKVKFIKSGLFANNFDLYGTFYEAGKEYIVGSGDDELRLDMAEAAYNDGFLYDKEKRNKQLEYETKVIVSEDIEKKKAGRPNKK